MQTFILFLNLWRTFAALDIRRLSKQRVEALHIYRVIAGFESGGRWRYAPAVRMWFGHDEVLKLYILICCRCWELRGGRNELMRQYIRQYRIDHIDHDRLAQQYPLWLQGEAGRVLTGSHRGQLCRKNPVTYRRFWPLLGLHKGYWWPIPPVARVALGLTHAQVLERFQRSEQQLADGTRTDLVKGMSYSVSYWKSCLSTYGYRGRQAAVLGQVEDEQEIASVGHDAEGCRASVPAQLRTRLRRDVRVVGTGRGGGAH